MFCSSCFVVMPMVLVSVPTILLQEGVLHTVADGAFAKPKVALTVAAALTPFGAFVNKRALRRREAALAAGN